MAEEYRPVAPTNLRPMMFLDVAREMMLSPDWSHRAVTETADWLEWVGWANPVLRRPYTVTDGFLHIPDVPGVGLDWDEDAVAAHLADLSMPTTLRLGTTVSSAGRARGTSARAAGNIRSPTGVADRVKFLRLQIYRACKLIVSAR